MVSQPKEYPNSDNTIDLFLHGGRVGVGSHNTELSWRLETNAENS